MAASAPNFTLQHPFYALLAPHRIKSRDFYDGSRAVKAKSETYLRKLKAESEERYTFRLERAVFDNHVANVVDTRQAFIWANPPDRELHPDLAVHLGNVDLRGSSADVFFERSALSAQIDGIGWILVTRTALAETATAADERDAAARFWFEFLRAESVVDWEYGPDKQLLYVVVQTSAEISPGPGMERTLRERWVVYERDKWTIWERMASADEKKKDDGPVRAATGVNPLGVVPIVPIYGVRDETRDGLGWPVTLDILDHQQSLYNKFSDRDMGEHLTNNPIPVIIAPESPGAINVSWGKGHYIPSNPGAGEIDVKYLEPTGKGIELSRASERDLIARIYETALRQTKLDSKAVQSDRTLRAERRSFDASLASVAREAQEAELACWRLAALFSGIGSIEAPAPVAVVYMTDFDDQLLDSSFLAVLSTMVERRQLSRETLWQTLDTSRLLPENFDPETEREKVERDRDDEGAPIPASGEVAPDEPEDDGAVPEEAAPADEAPEGLPGADQG